MYPDEISRQQAQTLGGAKTVRFDASDLMPEAMNNAFLKGILDFVQSPGNLDTVLSSLDKTQQETRR